MKLRFFASHARILSGPVQATTPLKLFGKASVRINLYLAEDQAFICRILRQIIYDPGQCKIWIADFGLRTLDRNGV